MMDKLALGMAVVCLGYFALFCAVYYFIEHPEMRWNSRRVITDFLKIPKKNSLDEHQRGE